MREIKLTQGKVALVDDRDYGWLNQWKWFAWWNRGVKAYYAVRSIVTTKGKNGTVYMAREIMGLKYGDKRKADHENHETLNNCRNNLRICTNQENGQNSRKRRTNYGRKCSSRYIGVYWNKDRSLWCAQIAPSGKTFNLGGFDSEIKAAKARDMAAKDYFGEFASFNFKE